ncbi:MAG: electron transport complex subunit RsxC [Xanthomonadales bacterium]|nr:electron transport complex subunit RsxC [Gammaproteobacteria bacterium]MBT8050697.1 electron transport complex subunit RsxC [Gammaproteobacteria bacterium]MBT8056682.1 electron transport complex subunit RsxC [Gammaproteobacteria bacterium]NNJ77922.1 electron transport complex subunit RsxC [Xanthomonadales bacterium]NNL03753.1 electron transport complex subunit RsxC [Xanthomonadales bacterium]
MAPASRRGTKMMLRRLHQRRLQERRQRQALEAGERLFPFHGGLRLRHHKTISCEHPLERTPLPQRLYVPLLQQSGREAEPVVGEGQQVLKGETIGRFRQWGSGCVHAPTSGVVSAIIKHPISHPSGMEGRCVVIRPDGLDTWIEPEPADNWQDLSPEELLRRIRESGIVGLGGAMFPTAFKVSDARNKGIHTLILNGSECEPYISCDEMLMREQPDSIVLGARILQRAVGAERTIIAIEDQMGAVHHALRDAVGRSGADAIDVIKVITLYPEGAEKQLIQVLTGLEVPSGGRPADLGLLCQNVATATAVARAVVEGKPLVERIVTVTGNGIRRPRNVLTAIGTPIADVVEQAGGYAPGAARLVLGGPMMGFPLANDRNPVTKAANCILVLTEKDLVAPQGELPCIRCGECAAACPARLLPQQLNRFIRAGRWTETADAGLADCIECGCCDIVCPSHIPLVEWFRFGKSHLRERAEERARADLARRRFEAREERLDRQKKERKQRIAEKKKALRDSRVSRDRIAEAIARSRKRRENDA